MLMMNFAIKQVFVAAIGAIGWMGAQCNFSSSEKLSRLGRKVCNAGVDQLGAEQQQHQNETRPTPSQTMMPP